MLVLCDHIVLCAIQYLPLLLYLEVEFWRATASFITHCYACIILFFNCYLSARSSDCCLQVLLPPSSYCREPWHLYSFCNPRLSNYCVECCACSELHIAYVIMCVCCFADALSPRFVLAAVGVRFVCGIFVVASTVRFSFCLGLQRWRILLGPIKRDDHAR